MLENKSPREVELLRKEEAGKIVTQEKTKLPRALAHLCPHQIVTEYHILNGDAQSMELNKCLNTLSLVLYNSTFSYFALGDPLEDFKQKGIMNRFVFQEKNILWSSKKQLPNSIKGTPFLKSKVELSQNYSSLFM